MADVAAYGCLLSLKLLLSVLLLFMLLVLQDEVMLLMEPTALAALERQVDFWQALISLRSATDSFNRLRLCLLFICVCLSPFFASACSL